MRALGWPPGRHMVRSWDPQVSRRRAGEVARVALRNRGAALERIGSPSERILTTDAACLAIHFDVGQGTSKAVLLFVHGYLSATSVGSKRLFVDAAQLRVGMGSPI